MVKAIKEENPMKGISRDSFKRMIKKAKCLGIFTVYETTRENGSQASNLYVFQRYPNDDNEFLFQENRESIGGMLHE